MKRVTVKNDTDLAVERGGLLFRPHSERTVSVGNVQYREIKAAVRLKVYPAEAADTVARAATKVDDGDIKTDAPTENTAKVSQEGDGGQEDSSNSATPEEPAQVETAAPTNTSDVEETQGGDDVAEGEFPCPHCDYEAKTEGGLKTHVRFKHPEQE